MMATIAELIDHKQLKKLEELKAQLKREEEKACQEKKK